MNKVTAMSLAIACIALAIFAIFYYEPFYFEPKSVNLELPSLTPSPTSDSSLNSTLVVPDDYSTLSDAVHSASEGAMIFIKKGTYLTNENPLIINKTLSIIGEDAANTILESPPDDRSGSGCLMIPKIAIHINADNFKLSNVTIINSDVGISVTGNGAQISNIVTTGITVRGSTSNISNNNISSITVSGSFNNVLYNSIVVIDCSGAYNMICSNIRSGFDGQIVIRDGYSNMIRNNSILWFGSVNSNSSKVYGNSIGSMGLDRSFNNKFIGNLVKGPYTQGIQLTSSSSNLFYGNTISDYNNDSANGVHYGNAISIGEGNSTDNSFYCNNFINNYGQIHFNGAFEANYKWDNGSMGNYWSDYSGLDEDGDGIGNTPYVISNDFEPDRYPLIAPFDISKINFDLIDLKLQVF